MRIETENRTKIRILLVEDSSVEGRRAKHSLENAGYSVKWARNGKDAIRIAKTKPAIDIILLDLVLPDISGIEVCHHLKENHNTNVIPIIMLSVKDDVADKVAGLAAGADDYLSKPYSVPELNARICACLRTKAPQCELREKNRQLTEKLEEAKMLAATDPLTSLFNRRHCEAIVEHEVQRAARFGSPLSCFMLDIDRFKSVNDNHGHYAGDTVLAEVAQILKSVMRTTDTAARLGGDEFLLMLPHTNNEGALIMAERLLNNISEYTFSGFPDIRITVSIGIASLPHPSIDTGAKLVNAADFALYEAKNRGRNLVVNGHEL